MRFPTLFAAALVALTLWSCTPDPNQPKRSTAPAPPQLFVDATNSSGIHFQHFNGRNGEFYYPEIIGSGVALLDYNNDGKLDILVLQGTPLGPGASADAPKDPCTARLYRNDLVVNADGTRKPEVYGCHRGIGALLARLRDGRRGRRHRQRRLRRRVHHPFRRAQSAVPEQLRRDLLPM